LALVARAHAGRLTQNDCVPCSGGERFVAQLLADPAHSVFNLYDSTLFAIGPALLVLGPYAHKTDREIPIVLLTEQNPPRRRNA
jgi:hypothetical protein